MKQIPITTKPIHLGCLLIWIWAKRSEYHHDKILFSEIEERSSCLWLCCELVDVDFKNITNTSTWKHYLFVMKHHILRSSSQSLSPPWQNVCARIFKNGRIFAMVCNLGWIKGHMFPAVELSACLARTRAWPQSAAQYKKEGNCLLFVNLRIFISFHRQQFVNVIITASVVCYQVVNTSFR